MVPGSRSGNFGEEQISCPYWDSNSGASSPSLIAITNTNFQLNFMKRGIGHIKKEMLAVEQTL